MKKRLLTIVLSILLCVGAMPQNSVFAADIGTSIDLRDDKYGLFHYVDGEIDYSFYNGKTVQQLGSDANMGIGYDAIMTDYHVQLQTVITDITDENNKKVLDYYRDSLLSGNKYQIDFYLWGTRNLGSYTFSKDETYSVLPEPSATPEVGWWDDSDDGVFKKDIGNDCLHLTYTIEIPVQKINKIDVSNYLNFPNDYSELLGKDVYSSCFNPIANPAISDGSLTYYFITSVFNKDDGSLIDGLNNIGDMAVEFSNDYKYGISLFIISKNEKFNVTNVSDESRLFDVNNISPYQEGMTATVWNGSSIQQNELAAKLIGSYTYPYDNSLGDDTVLWIRYPLFDLTTKQEQTTNKYVENISLPSNLFTLPTYSQLKSYSESEKTLGFVLESIYPHYYDANDSYKTDFDDFEIGDFWFFDDEDNPIDLDTDSLFSNINCDNGYNLYIEFISKIDDNYYFDSSQFSITDIQPCPSKKLEIDSSKCSVIYHIVPGGEGTGEEPSVIECSTWTSLREGINDLFEDGPVEVPNSATFKLTQDITAPDNEVTLSITDGMDVTIDLNGHVLNRNLINANGTTKERPSVASGDFVPYYYNYSGSGSVIEVWGGKLTIKDSSPNTEHAGYVDSYSLWHLGTGSGKAKTIKGGIITGGIGMKYNPEFNASGSYSGMFNDKEMGGGILIANSQNAEVRLEGGNICGNLANHFGGGVAIIYSDNLPEINPVNKSKFIMDGGSICNNYVAYDTDSDNYLDDRLGGGGIYAFQGDVEINGGHIDENCSKHFAGGILGYANADIKITGGTINNNIGRITGAIWNYLNDNENHNEFSFTNDSIPEDLLLTAGEGKEIVITGNKSKERGNVYSNRLYLSGKVIIKDNVCDYVVVTKDKGFTSTACPDPQTGKLPIKDEYDYPIIKAWANDLMFITIDDAYSIIHPGTYPQFYTMYNGEINPINIVGNLTGSDINISVIGVDFPPINPASPDAGVCLWEITSGYLENNPNAKVDEFIHYNGPSMYYLAYDENWSEGEILVKPSQVKEVDSVDKFNSAINDAIELFEKEPTSTCTIELSNSIGSQEEPIEELYIPENANLELNGNDIYVDNILFIEGDLSDSKKTDEEGKVVKGKLYMNDPSNLVYESVIEAKENDETRQELVWTEATGNLKGYYCMYEIGANTKWDKTNKGKEWKKLGDKEAKFKIQPTAYDDLLKLLKDNNYCDVYDKEHKVKVGLRLSVVKDGTNNPVTYDFAFSDDLTSKWASGEEGSPTTKCMSFNIIGLGSCRSVSAQAAIYSKPDANIRNAEFHSKLNVAGE